jgi:membrane fusion protein (multidrug efflux system)
MKINYKDAKIKIQKFKRTKTPMQLMLISLFVLFAIVLIVHLFKSYRMSEYLDDQSKEAVTVSTFKVEYQNWTSELTTFGSLRTVQGIYVTAELPGLIESTPLKDGQDVKKGDVILQLVADDDIALLKSLEAQAKLAEITYLRDKEQFAINVVSKETLDTDFYTMQNLQELANQQAAIVKKKTIRAEFSGKLGVHLVDPGEYLNPGDPIVALQNTDDLFIDFYMPEKNISKLKKGQEMLITSEAYPGKVFHAKVHAIDPLVSLDSRNIRVEGIIRSLTGELLSGMYVSVTVIAGEPTRKLTIPQAAISYNPYGNLVYVVTTKDKNIDDDNENDDDHKEEDDNNPKKGDDKKKDDDDDDEDHKKDDDKKHELYVEQKFVTLGEMRGDQVVVLSGLKEGDQIVTSGQLKLKNHSNIIINNKVIPSNDANPVVEDEQKI